MIQLKELYKGRSLDDLKPFYSKLGDLRKIKLKTLLTSTQKVYEEAEKQLMEGDEELSYILFMKYFNLIDQIRKSPDYSKEKYNITEMLGGSKRQKLAMDKAEQLSRSLEKRYKMLSENQTETSQINRSINSSDMITMSPAGSTSNNGEDIEEINPSSSRTCEELYRLTQDPKASLLIMDCRPKDDFIMSRLNYPHCVNVPEEIILPGMSAGAIQQQLEPGSKALWASRSVKDNVVLMDWNCPGPEPTLHTPIWHLKDILRNWDPDVVYKSIQILNGGYENYILMYPMQCNNPNVQAPASLKSDMEILDNIEYPSINDIIMKDDINYGSPQKKFNARPGIDRSSKAAALAKYDQTPRIMDILEQQEMIVDKTLDTQQKLRGAKDQLQTISNEVKNTEAEEQKNKLLAGQQELIYNILQLQSNEYDYKLEIQYLKEQLEEFRRREKELGEAITEKEAENLEETAKRIEVKQDQIDETREKIELNEKEKRLVVARNEKRHLKPPTDDDDETLKPKIPQYDRSIKPVIDRPVYGRDFSPVPGPSPYPGLTGLKNLGNTCYMNSIMQCLSNTAPLVEYFKTNRYKKNINETNKTKGKIVEEVAELIKVLWSGKFKCVASKDLRFVIGQYQQIFRGVEQQDSHEFLTILMDWLHSDLQTLVVNESPSEHLPPSENAWLDYVKSRESFILKLFYGQIKSTVKCAKCSKESATYECFSNLSLELPQMRNRCCLNECLNMYFYGEQIFGWNCPNCKQKREAVKKLDISKLPPILVIHLKRFYADSDLLGGTIYRKKQTYVGFPLSKFDMKEYIAPSEQRTARSTSYRLYAVSNHYGSMESGHYTAFCRSPVLGRWFKFDDQVVSALDETDVVSSAAYILFYTCIPEAPGESN